MKQYQHGDVLIQQVRGLPKGAKRRKFNGVLVDGEHTGHAHRIAVKDADVWELDGQIYLEMKSPSPITHEEHKPIDIPEGIYQIGRVKEYDYLQDLERNVID